ncbi:MAG: S-layer homology domain-containing protein, partial [Bacillota bacterium]
MLVRRVALKCAAVVVCWLIVAGFVPAAGATGNVFPDVRGHWAKREVLRGVSLGFLDGYPDGLFRPDNQVSRAEFAKMVAAAFGLGRGAGEAVFEDCRGAWFEPYLVAACSAGVVVPDEYGGFYRPDEPIPRAEAAAYLVRVLGRGASAALRSAGECPLSDVDEVPALWRGAVVEAYLLGVLRGYPDGTARGQAGSSRAEAVAMLLRALDARGRVAEVAPARVAPSPGERTYAAAGSLLARDIGSGREWNVSADGEFSLSWQPGESVRVDGAGDLQSFCAGKLPDPADLVRVLAKLPCPKCERWKELLVLLACPWPEEVSAGSVRPNWPGEEEEVDITWSAGDESLVLEGSVAGPAAAPSEGQLLLRRDLRVRWEVRSGGVLGSGDLSATVWYDPARLWVSRVTVLLHGAWESGGERVVASG